MALDMDSLLELELQHTEDEEQHLAHTNCTLFCAPNAQKRTGSQQGKKTFFLDVRRT